MSHYQDFSSWQPDQERHFVVFEQASQENGKKARVTGIVAAAGAFFLIVAVVFSFEKPKPMDSDLPPDDVGAERAAAPAPAAAVEPAADPAAAAPADPAAAAADPAAAAADPAAAAAAPPAEAAAPAAGDTAAVTTPPPPPKGMTKAPPTALIKK